MPTNPPDTEWVVERCGCGHGVVGEAYVFEPCRPSCRLYRYFRREATRQHGQAPVSIDNAADFRQ